MSSFKAILSGAILMCSSILCMGQEPTAGTSAIFEQMEAKLDEYFQALSHESVDTKCEEVDFLISSCTDSLLQQHVALYSYSHYMESKLMGDEAVPVHLTDKWFSTGKIKMKEDFDLLNAMVFAEFNRQSLIGKKAPSLRLETFEGDSLSFIPGTKRPAILYFYDTGCAKCKLETPLLSRALSNVPYPVDLFAIYVGSSKEAWKDYMDEKFSLNGASATVHHLWDRDRSSDFERNYGVLQTPQMVLVDRSGSILGRRLDTESLLILLDNIFVSREYQYGNYSSSKMFDSIFEADDGKTVMNVADHIAESTLVKGDTLTFKKLSGDLLYWLSSQKGETFRSSTDAFIRKYITAENGIWSDEWDSLKIVGLGQMMQDLYAKSPVGEKVSSIKVKGTLVSSKGSKTKKVNLAKLKAKKNYILFHTEGCRKCQMELQAAGQMIKEDSSMQVFEINVDRILSDKNLSNKLMDTFDLSSLPFMILTDENGFIKRKYISFVHE